MALYRKLNRETRVRKSILSGLTKSVLEFGYVETTEQRAKEARKFVDKMITYAKKGDLVSRRKALAFLNNDKDLVKKTVSNIQEVITRGAKTLVVSNLDIDKSMFDVVIDIPETNCFVSPILSIVPLQLLAYHISKEKGLDVDKPRNLAKSVTVE